MISRRLVMRSKLKTMSVAAVLMAGVLASMIGTADRAEAGGFCLRDCPPAGWGRVRPITHYVYYPRYHHTYNVHYATDPFAYRYDGVRWYPGRSRYWSHHYRTPRPDVDLPPYYEAWGYERPYRKARQHRWHRHHRHHHHD